MAIDRFLSLRLANRLTLIPECPQGKEAVEALADAIGGLSRDETEARAIVNEACSKWDRWRGPHGLIAVALALRPAPPPANQAVDLGPKPEVECETCGDWGYFSRGQTIAWCDCRAGRDTRERIPGLVDSLNRKHVKPLHEAAAVARPRITQADIDQAFADRQDRTEKMIQDERAILDDPAAPPDRKEIARAVLGRVNAL